MSWKSMQDEGKKTKVNPRHSPMRMMLRNRGSRRRKIQKKYKRDQIRKTVQNYLRAFKRIFRLTTVLKFVLATSVVLVLLLGLATIVIDIVIDADDLVTLQQEAVDQLGLQLEVKHADFNIYRHFIMRDVAIFVKAFPEQPLLTVKAVQIHYNLPAILLGSLQISKIKLVDPQVFLVQRDGRWNFSTIGRKTPSTQSTEPALKVANETDKAENITALDPKFFFLPFRLKIGDVGFKNLSVSIQKFKDQQKVQEIRAGGLSANIALNWLGTRSKIMFSLQDADGIAFQIQEQGEIYANASFNLSQKLVLEDLTHLTFDWEMSQVKLEARDQVFNNLNQRIKLRTSVDESRMGIHIQEFDIQAAQALSFDLAGNVFWAKNGFKAPELDLQQDIQLDLNPLCQLAEKFVSEFHCGGELHLDDFSIRGALDLGGFESIETANLPLINGQLYVEKLHAKGKKLPVTFSPIDGMVAMTVMPNLMGEGSQVDLGIQLRNDSFALKHIVDGMPIHVNIEHFNLDTALRASLVDKKIPHVRLSAEAGMMRLASKSEIWAKPFALDLTGNGDQKLSKNEIDIELNWGKLIDVAISAICRQGCQSIQSRFLVATFLDPFEDLVGQLDHLQDKLPSKLAGKLSASGQVKAQLGTMDNLSPENILQHLQTEFDLTVRTEDFSVRLPDPDIDMDGFDLVLVFSGNEIDQQLKLSQDLKNFHIIMPDGKDAKVTEQNFELQIHNKILKPVAVTKLQQNTKTTIKGGLSARRIIASEMLPFPMSDLSIQYDFEQSKLQQITLNSISLALPSLGGRVKSSGSLNLSKDMKPESFSSKVRVDLAANADNSVIEKLRSSGRIALSVMADSVDMKHMDIDGLMEFEDFTFALAGETEESPKVIDVEQLDGKLPFKQKIDLGALLEKPKLPTQEANLVAEKKVLDPLVAYINKSQDRLKDATNVMAMVDYGSIRDFYPKRKPISIEKIEVANLTFSQMEFDFEVRQNWIALNDFVINFLDGKIQGDFQLAFDPKPRAVRTSLHLTRLDSRKLVEKFPQLAEKASSWTLTGSPYIDATVHFRFDLMSKDMDGAVEITSIGHEQLNMILYYVDPKQENPTIANIRAALAVGDLREVKVPIKNGYMGMEVDIRLFSVPIRVPKLRRFPLVQFIDNFGGNEADLDANQES